MLHVVVDEVIAGALAERGERSALTVVTGFRTALLDPLSTAITSPRFSISCVHNGGVDLTDASGVEGFSYAHVFDEHSVRAVEELITLFAASYVGTEAQDVRAVRTSLLTTKANFLGVRGLVRLATSALGVPEESLLRSPSLVFDPDLEAPVGTMSELRGLYMEEGSVAHDTPLPDGDIVDSSFQEPVVARRPRRRSPTLRSRRGEVRVGIDRLASSEHGQGRGSPCRTPAPRAVTSTPARVCRR